MTYIPGEYLVVCDRCGLRRYRGECQFTWDNLLVCRDTCWEPKHPQWYVKNIHNVQRVPDPRPDFKISQNTTTLSSAASKDARSVVVSSASNINRYDSIGITLDGMSNNATDLAMIVQWVLVDPAPSGTTIYINVPLWDDASSGNTVYLSYHEKVATATQYTATML